jgi:hypothetical protein
VTLFALGGIVKTQHALAVPVQGRAQAAVNRAVRFGADEHRDYQ